MFQRVGPKCFLNSLFMVISFSILLLYAMTLDSTNFILMDDTVLDPPINSSIFFLETSDWASTGAALLTPRQGCAVESAALMNPNRQVFLMFSSPIVTCMHSKDLVFKNLLTYKNIHIVRLYLDRFFADTPLRNWLDTGKLMDSDHVTHQKSNVLRFLVLWKYGGTYMDLDVIVAKPLDALGMNWAALEDWDKGPDAGIINYALGGVGRLFTNMALRQIKRHFKANVWNNTQALMERVMRKICRDHELPGPVEDIRCQGLKLFHPEIFFPIPDLDWVLYFKPKGMKRLKSVENITYVFHTWNKLYRQVGVDGLANMVNIPYTYLARKFCPRVYADTKNNFFAQRDINRDINRDIKRDIHRNIM